MNRQPLVSICLISYCSKDTIIETLESIKRQTYSNIELVISDDGSKDGTVEVCENWINSNKKRFKRTILITVDKNSGTSANYNRAIDNSEGEWIKTIDGDDILLPECIEDNVNFVIKNPDAKIVFSNCDTFHKSEGGNNIIKHRNLQDYTKGVFKMSTREQLVFLLGHNTIPSPTSFLHSATIKEYRFDERFKFLEDAPMWIRLTEAGFHMYAFEKTTALYRVEESVSRSQTKYFSQLLYDSSVSYFWTERIHLIRKYNANDAYNKLRKLYMLYDIADLLFDNKKTKGHDIVINLIRIFLNKCVDFKLR